VDGAELLDLLGAAADATIASLAATGDWGPSGRREGQYASDLVADRAALSILHDAGLDVVSEESGRTGQGTSGVVVVVDPLDGSTNASRGVSWWGTSLCAVDHDGPAAAVVHDIRHEVRYTAARGGGARRDGEAIWPSGATALADSLVALSGLPPCHLGWRQFRALGAVALDLCAVADGTLDGFIDCSPSAHGVWDYLGGLLVCREAGAVVADGLGRELVTLDHADRRTPVAAATPQLLAEIVAARRTF
jgi:fructose-1,6-bisphosphatase/inositol monophosphatase family enzyme